MDMGFTHEDGCVISDEAAEKMATKVKITSVIYSDAPLGRDEVEDGGIVLINEGDEVRYGTPLARTVLPPEIAKSDVIDDSIVTIESSATRRMRQHVYTSNMTGVVEEIKTKTELHEGIMKYRTEVVTVCVHHCGRGSKVAGRHSNKHIVGAVFPKNKMPIAVINGECVHVDMVVSPMTVGGRMNPSLVMEAMIGLGLRYIEDDWHIAVEQFSKDYDFKDTAKWLSNHGLPEDSMFHLEYNGKILPEKTLVGPVFVSRLHHHAPDKIRMANKPIHDHRGVPRFGAGTQGIGREEIEVLFEHGCHEMIREVLLNSEIADTTDLIDDYAQISGYKMEV
jgi:DNA-directed RNA polymerase beta subunit